MAGVPTTLALFLAIAVSGAWGTERDASKDECASNSDDTPRCMTPKKGLFQKKVGNHAALMDEDGRNDQVDVQEEDANLSMHGKRNQLQKWSVKKIPGCMIKKWARHREEWNQLWSLKGRSQSKAKKAAENAKKFQADLAVIYDDVMTNEIMEGQYNKTLQSVILAKWKSIPGPYAHIMKKLKGKNSDAFDKEYRVWGKFAHDLTLLSTHRFLHGCLEKNTKMKTKKMKTTRASAPATTGAAPATTGAAPATTGAAPVPGPLIPPGVVAFQGGRENKWCADEGGRVVCNRPKIGKWERFTVELAGPGKIKLKGGNYGKYCSDTWPWGVVRCNRNEAKGWEIFNVEAHGGGIALQGGRGGGWCSDEGLHVVCNRGWKKSWETFKKSTFPEKK